MLDKLKDLHQKHKKQFPSDKAYYDFLMFQIQSHMVEIDDLRQKKDSQMKDEMADMALLVHLLALSHGVDGKIFEERLRKVQEGMKNP